MTHRSDFNQPGRLDRQFSDADCPPNLYPLPEEYARRLRKFEGQRRAERYLVFRMEARRILFSLAWLVAVLVLIVLGIIVLDFAGGFR